MAGLKTKKRGEFKLNKAIVFDFDGVIIDSLELQKFAYEKSYQIVIGKPPKRFSEFITYSGSSLTHIISSMNLPEEMCDKYIEISRERLDLIKVFPGAKQLLERLKAGQYKCGLCTGKDRERTIEILKIMDLYSYFDAIVCSDDVNNPKPHAESLQLVTRKLKVRNVDCLMVGDSKNDILCAKNAKIISVAVDWGAFDKETLLKKSPDYYVENFDKLYNCIGSHFNIQDHTF